MHEKPKPPEPRRYADMDYNELAVLYNAHNKEGGDQKIKRDVMKMMRTWLRNQELAIQEEEKAEKAESEKQRRILKETTNNLRDTRKCYLDMYREMNKFITSRSMVTNVDNFEQAVNVYKNSASKFWVAIDAHIGKMREAQEEGSDLVITQEQNVGT